MANLFNSSNYYNKGQSNLRFMRHPPQAAAPTALSVSSSGLDTTDFDQFAWAQIALNPPAAPSWAVGMHYITAYQFVLTTTVQGETRTSRFYIPDEGSGPYLIGQLIPGASYQLAVNAFDYMGQPGLTATLNFTAHTDTTPPRAPIVTAFALPGGGAQIALDAINNEFDFAHYELWRGRGYNASSQTWGVAPALVLQFMGGTVNDLAIPGTEPDYFYYVRALDLSGNVATSNIAGPVSVVSTTPPIPVAPDLTHATATALADGSINFAFPASSDPNLAYYRIWRRTDTGSWVLLETLSAAPSTGTVTYNDSFTISGTRYHYSVSVANSSGEDSGFATTPDINATALETTAPAPPTNLLFAGGLGSIQLNWTPSPARNVVFYAVSWRWAPVGPPAWTTWSAPLLVTGSGYDVLDIIDPLTGLAFSREQLANNFQASVVAVDAAGNTSTALVAAAQYPQLMGYIPSDGVIPPAPLTLQVPGTLPNDGSVPLSWSTPAAGDIYGYQIEQYDTITARWEFIGIIKASGTPSNFYTATGLEPYNFQQRQYRFRVRTINNGGDISEVNLIENPGFETGLANWTATTDSGAVTNWVSLVTETWNSSAGALLSNYAGREQQVVPVSVGSSYTFSAYMAKDPARAAGTARIRLRWLNASQAIISMLESGALPALASYQRLTVSGIAPAGAVSAQVELTGDPSQTSQTFLWDSSQFEASFLATPYGDGKTGLLSVLDTAGPQDYGSIALEVSGSLGQLNLRWMNPTSATPGSFEYINGTFEIWRKVIASSQPGLPVDTSFRKIAEVYAANDGAQNGYDDLDPLETINITAQYELIGRDRFGNEGPVLNGGNYVQGRSMTLNDFDVPTEDSTPPAQPDMTTATAVAQSDGTILFTFNGVSDGDTQGYVIYRRHTGASTFDVLTTLTQGPGTQVRYTDGAIILGQSYDYTASAFDDSGNNSTYDSVHFKTAVSTDSRPPATPISAVLAGGLGRISCSWQQPASTPGADHFEFQFTTNNGTSWSTAVLVASTSFDVLSMALSKAQLQAGFLFRVRAIAPGGGASAYLTSALPTAANLQNYIPSDSTPPAQPTGFTDTLGVNSDVLLAWNANTDTDLWGYRIARQFNGGAWEWLVDIAASAPRSYRDTGLEPYSYRGYSYAYNLWAIDNSGNLSTSPAALLNVQINGTTPPSYAGLPVQLNLTATPGLGAITLNWNNGSGISFIDCTYEIFRATSAAGPFTKIDEEAGSDDASPNSWTDFSPSDATASTYYYNLLVYDRWGNTSGILNPSPVSATSLTVYDFPVKPDTTPPAQPDMTTATAAAQTDGTILFSFNGVTDSDLFGYVIYRRHTGASSFDALADIKHGPGGVIHYYDGSVVLGQSYDYTASSFDRSGNESAYDSANFKTAVATDGRSPAVPTNPVMSGGVGRISCSWQQPAGQPQVDHYEFQYTLNSGALWSSTILLPGSAFDVLGLSLSKAALQAGFEFQVRAVGASGAYSAYLLSGFPSTANLQNYVPSDATPPAQPTGLVCTPGQDCDVVLTWAANTDTDLWGYRLERQYNGQGWEALLDISASASRSYRDTGLEPFAFRGRKYDYRVWAIDNSGNLSSSPCTVTGVVISDTTPPAETPAQLALSSVGQLGAISLSWNNGSGYPFIDCVYEIWRSPDAVQGDFIKVAEQLGSDDGSPNSWIDFSPSDTVASTYFYNLKVYDRWGNESGFLNLDAQGHFLPVSATSLTVSQVNPPDTTPPARVFVQTAQAQAQDDGSIRVSWGNQYTTDLAGYTVYRRRSAHGESFVAVGSIPANPQIGENWLLYSEQFDNAAWVKTSGVTVSANATTDPIGGHTADQINLPASSGGSLVGISQVINPPANLAGESYTASLWLWATAANIPIELLLQDQPATGLMTQVAALTLGTTPVRCSVTVPRPAAGSNASLLFMVRQPWSGSSPAKTLYAWGAQIERWTSPGAYYTTTTPAHAFESDGTNAAVYVDPSLVLGQSYDYNLSADDRSNNDSGFDPTVYKTAISGDVRVPQPPTGVLGRGSVSRVDVTWTPSVTQGITQYDVLWSLDAGATWPNSARVVGSQFSVPLVNAQPATWVEANLRVQVYAVNRSGTGRSATSAAMPVLQASDMIGYVPLDVTPPDAPASMTAVSDTNGDVLLSWTPSVATDLNHYYIEVDYDPQSQSPVGSGPWQSLTTVPAVSTGYRVSGLSLYANTGKYYRFRISAVDNGGNFSTTATSSNDIAPQVSLIPPAVPNGGAALASPPCYFTNDASGGTATASLAWVGNTEQNIFGYFVAYRAHDGSTPLVSVFVPQASTYVVIPGIKQGTYDFMVAAINTSAVSSTYTPPCTLTSQTAGSNQKPATPILNAGDCYWLGDGVGQSGDASIVDMSAYFQGPNAGTLSAMEIYIQETSTKNPDPWAGGNPPSNKLAYNEVVPPNPSAYTISTPQDPYPYSQGGRMRYYWICVRARVTGNTVYTASDYSVHVAISVGPAQDGGGPP